MVSVFCRLSSLVGGACVVPATWLSILVGGAGVSRARSRGGGGGCRGCAPPL